MHTQKNSLKLCQTATCNAIQCKIIFGRCCYSPELHRHRRLERVLERLLAVQPPGVCRQVLLPHMHHDGDIAALGTASHDGRERCFVNLVVVNQCNFPIRLAKKKKWEQLIALVQSPFRRYKIFFLFNIMIISRII